MQTGSNARPWYASSWASLGVLLGVFALALVLWGLLLAAWFRLPLSTLGHLDAIARPILDVYTIGLYVGLLACIGWFWTRWEHRGWSDLSARWSTRQFASGCVIGTGGLAAIYCAALALGWSRFVPPPSWPWTTILADLAAAAAMGLAEEVLFRGILLRTLLRDQRPWVAIACSAALYAGAHFARPGLTLATSLVPFSGLFLTGLLFGYAAWSTRGLWLSWGMHATWIVFIALSSQLNLWAYAPTAARWTGNGYPPSGLLAVLVMGSCLVALMLDHRRRIT